MATPIPNNIVAIGHDQSSTSPTLYVYEEDLTNLWTSNAGTRSARIAIDSTAKVFSADNQSAGTIKKFDTDGSLLATTTYTSAYTPLDIAFNYEQDLIVSEGINANNGSYIAFLDRDFNLLSRTMTNGQKIKQLDVTYGPGGSSRLYTAGDSVYNDDTSNWGAKRVYTMHNNIPELEYRATTFYDSTPAGATDSSYRVATSEDRQRYAYQETLQTGSSAKARVVVYNADDHSIDAVFTSDGAYIDYDGNAATGIYLGDTPRSVEFDRDGNIIIDCQYAVQKYDSSYSIVYSESKQLQSAFNGTPIAVDSTGNAWTYDQTRVSVFSPSGTRSDINNNNRGPFDITARQNWWGEPIQPSSTTEVCRTAVTLTPLNAGGTFLTTAQSKFGNSSLYGNNSGWLKADSLVIPQTGEFTLECWFRSNGAWPSGYTTLFSNYNSSISNGSFHVSVYLNNINVFMKDTVNGNFAHSTTSAPTNTWHHIAFQRNSSNQMSIYFNGARIVHDTSQPTTINNNNLYIGGREFGFAAPTYTKCYIDEARASDVARYSGTSITVPTLPFDADADDVLLMHYEGTEGQTLFEDDNCYDVATSAEHNIVSLYAGATTSGVFSKASGMILKAVGTVATGLQKATSKSLDTLVSTASSLVISSQKVLNLATTVLSSASSALQAGFSRTLSATVSATSTLDVVKTILKNLVTTVSATSTLDAVKTIVKNLVTSVSTAASLDKQSAFIRALSSTVNAATSLVTNSVILRALSATVNAATSTKRNIGKVLTATVGSVSDAARILPEVALNAVVSITTGIQKAVTKAIDTSVSSTTQLTKQSAFTRALNAIGTVSSSMQKGINKALNATVSNVTSMQKAIVKTLTASVTSLSSIAKRVTSGIQLVAGVVANASVQKSIGKVFNATVSNTINIRKAIHKLINDVVVSTESVTRPILKIYETLIASSVISYLMERVDDVLRKARSTSEDTMNPTETSTFKKDDDA